MPDIPTTLPTALVAGNTWIWDRSYADYPASSWTATAYFERVDKTFSAAASASGSAHRFTIAAATTASYPAGHYRIRVRVTDGTQVFIAESGWCDVEVDPAASGTTETRSWARRTLDALEQLLEQFATTAIQSGSIEGRSYSRSDLQSLTQWRDKLRVEVQREEMGSKAAASRNIKVRLSRP